MKKAVVILIVLFSIFSCKNEEEKVEAKITKPATKKIEFGFNYADFNIVNDTISKGDSFGSIMQSQNIGDKKVHDIVEQVKDSFNVRSIRYGKPFTLLRAKNKTNNLQVFIYQPDALSLSLIHI